MATTNGSPISDGPKAALERGYDAVAGSPAKVLSSLGITLFVVAYVLQDGIWAAVLGVWGAALVLVGLSLRLAVWWSRR